MPKRRLTASVEGLLGETEGVAEIAGDTERLGEAFGDSAAADKLGVANGDAVSEGDGAKRDSRANASLFSWCELPAASFAKTQTTGD